MDVGLPTAATGADLPPRRRRRRPGRLLSYLVTVWFILTLNFALPRAMPGDPIKAMLTTSGSSRGLSAQEVKAAAQYYGLDKPLWKQYVHYLGDLARGDLGTSIPYSRPVSSLLADRLPWTLLLGFSTVTLGTLLGMVTGVHSGWRRGSAADRALLGLCAGMGVLPPFFVASLAAFVFSAKLGWFPLGGATTPFATTSGLAATVSDVAWHLVLPLTTGSTLFLAITYLTMRAGMVGELGADYLLLGRAKGLKERRLEFAYAGRNAILPLIATTALGLGVTASTGVVFVEIVFSYPGVGRLLFESINFRDYPTLQGCFLVVALTVVTANFLADVLQARLDPRTTA